jgi:RHS repeat-associated protein
MRRVFILPLPPDGHRSLKRVYFKNPGGGVSHIEETYYIRDASGNIMATYKQQAQDFTWQSSVIYGSARLGMVEPNMLLHDASGPVSSSVPSDEITLYQGVKRYELSNHLGNVLAVVSDKRTQICVNGTQYYEAEVITAQDYYPFGMVIKERTWSSSSYRFGFNGYEKVDEVAGQGNSYTTEHRQYDPRLIRWFSIDKFASLYSSISPYVGMLNNPLAYIDVAGDSVELIIGRPYTDAYGEYHPYGHAALRVFNAVEGYDMVYDFGRYGETWGIGQGEGILNVYDKPENYIKAEMKLRSSVGYMKPTTVADDKKIMVHFKGLTDAGEVYSGTGGAVPGGGGTAYKLKEDYSVLSNNCLTQACTGLDLIGKNWFGDEYKPNSAYEELESIYTFERLKRTEYNKGGKINVTYTPPNLEEVKTDDRIYKPEEFIQPQDILRSPPNY